MNKHAQSLKEYIGEERRRAESAHRSGADSFATCAALVTMMDEAIGRAFRTLPDDLQSAVAVLALGGYGRGELFPYSDIDIMVLCETGTAKGLAEDAATRFLHVLWDADLDVGHSVRTVDEALSLHGKTLDAWTSMLESRLVVGSESLACALYDGLVPRPLRSPDTWLIDGIFADQKARHERFGSSVKLLEPNVKKSAGGLRDLHTVYWLFRGSDGSMGEFRRAGLPATRAFLDVQRAGGELDEFQHSAGIQALEFIGRVRHEMHFQRSSQHDTLEYAVQHAVASGLGYGLQEGAPAPQSGERAVEVFMRDYYRHARTVQSLNVQLSLRFREYVEPSRHAAGARELIRGVFSVENDRLGLVRGVTRLTDPVTIFDAFVLSAERELELDFRLRGAIERSVDVISPAHAADPTLASMFRRILRSNRVGPTLRVMNDLNVLGTYIPEFGRLVAFFQHNVYHYFTADEHTLIAIEHAEMLRMERGMLHEVFRLLRRKDILYIALLLHDIAKPIGVADHEVTGVEVARTVLRRIGLDDEFPQVAFLIRHHLLMEQVAFRRNVHDPATIREFATRFDQPEWLDYLYLLTYADLSALNTNVWTEWKGAMLQELYQRTAEVLRRNLRGEQIDRFHQDLREEATEALVNSLSQDIPRDVVEHHLREMQSDAYVSSFSDQEISRHIRQIAAGAPISTLFSHAEGYTEVTVIARDAPFALSRFCAVLAANDANIFDANIFTRSDGVIIDRFRVSDASRKQELEQRVCAKITDDLAEVWAGTLDLAHLFQEHHRRWKRRPKLPPNPDIRMDVEFEDNPRYTIIDVYAPDSVGFLYRVTETISRLGLDIYFAKIATRVDGIVDAFYVLDRAGSRVTDPAKQLTIREEILGTIRKIAGHQLV